MTIIAIDIGNTRTHIALIDNSIHECIARQDILSADLKKNLLSAINTLCNQTGIPGCCDIIVSSVIKSALKETTGLFQNKNIPVKQFCYNENLPVKFNYSNPLSLGTDRIADALYGYMMYPGENLVLIGSGTALTVDLLRGQQFLGGAILPGLDMQFRSLHYSTDALPEISLTGTCQLPGNSTEECIRAGVLYGTGGALNNIVSQYSRQLNGNIKVLVTGGAWPLLENFVNFEFLFIPDMTLIGISLFTDVHY